jgi:hypothetical protein
MVAGHHRLRLSLMASSSHHGALHQWTRARHPVPMSAEQLSRSRLGRLI